MPTIFRFASQRRRALTLALLTAGLCSGAWADFTVYPTRVELTDTKRVANLSIRHNDDKAGNYRVTATFFRMKSNGSMERVEDPTPEERPLAKYLRFSPRQLTLAPRTEQVIRVMFAGPSSLPEGDYRAHLFIEPVDAPPAAESPTESKADAKAPEQADKKETKIDLKLEARLAFAIPVIFHRGKPTFNVKLENVRLLSSAETQPQASVDVVWSGNGFPFGDFDAIFAGKGGEPATVGKVRAAAAYVSPRTVTIPLSSTKDKLKDGTLRIEFRQPEEVGGKVIEAVEAKLP